jgi:hypothetical protein
MLNEDLQFMLNLAKEMREQDDRENSIVTICNRKKFIKSEDATIYLNNKNDAKTTSFQEVVDYHRDNKE